MSRGNSGRKKSVKKLIMVIIILLASFFGVIEFSEYNEQTNPSENIGNIVNSDERLIITMIDVGQADSFLLVQNGEVALIDCGTSSTSKRIVEYLSEQGITHIDYVFGTHPHDDHMGGMQKVITSVDVDNIYIPDIKDGDVVSNWYMKLINTFNVGNYNVKHPKVGDEYQLGEATIKIIGPISEPKDNLNNYSTVMKVSFGEMDIIFTGDAEKIVESEILDSGVNLEAEILKVGHHGSDTSTSQEFLDAISPEYALISAKVGNKYEHPTASTMEDLKKRGIEVYRTDENGNVVIELSPNNVQFNCEPGDYLSGVELEKKVNK